MTTPSYDLTTAHHASMASLARSMGLGEAGALCLPTVLEACASASGRKASDILFRAHQNPGLRTYIKEVLERLILNAAEDIAVILTQKRG